MSHDGAEHSMTHDEWDGLNYEKARNIDDQVDHDQATKMAFNKLVARLGTRPDESDVGPMEAAYRTISKFDELADRVARLEDQMDKVDRAAETALTVAETEAKPGDSVSKKRIALLKSRNELIRKLALDRSNSHGAAVTAPEVQEMAKPEVKIYHQTVYDAWDELEGNWDAFNRGTNQDGGKVLRVSKDDLDPALVKSVESALDRDDLAKRLLSEAEREGV